MFNGIKRCQVMLDRKRKTNALRDSRNMYRQLNKNIEYV